MVTISEALTIAFQSYQTGHFSEAEAVCLQVLQRQPDHPVALHLMGVVLHQLGRTEGAILYYQQAIAVDPKNADAYNNLGVSLQSQGKLQDAIDHYKTAISLQPDYAQAYYNLGNTLQAMGKFNDAIAQFRHALALNPKYVSACNNLGSMLEKQGQLEDAIAYFKQAIAIDPNYITAYTNLGNALQEQGQLEDAIECYQQAIALQPNNADTYYNLGRAFQEQTQFDVAASCYQKALTLRPTVEAYNNLGLVLKLQGQPEAAIVKFQQALVLNPLSADVLANMGDAYLEQGKLEQAINCFDRALQLAPKHVHAHSNRGFALALAGDFQPGFSEYTQYLWRWIRQKYALPSYLKKCWDGSPLKGKPILIYFGEDVGFGDGIQFIRYAPLIVDRGGQVVVQCQPALTRLLKTVKGVQEVIPHGTLLPSQTYIPLMFLPSVFETTLDTIPAQVPYLTPPATPTLPSAQSGTRLKVGLVWASAPRAPRSLYRQRSCPLKTLLPLFNLPEIAFYSLQKGDAAQELAELESDQIQDVSPLLDDFADTAAAIAQLDLVISVDTAVAHLAGALAKPVWMLLPIAPDCRWMLERQDSPWYPTMQIFRQTAPGYWQTVVTDLVEALKHRLKDS